MGQDNAKGESRVPGWVLDTQGRGMGSSKDAGPTLKLAGPAARLDRNDVTTMSYLRRRVRVAPPRIIQGNPPLNIVPLGCRPGQGEDSWNLHALN